METSIRLDGKRTLVTGAGRGIGAELARGLAAAGAEVIAAARTLAEVEAVAESIRAGGGHAHARPLDLTDYDAIEPFVEEITATVGEVDILVNNAGTSGHAPALEVTEALWDEVIGVNLHGLFFLTQVIGCQMLARGQGNIINIASTFSVVGLPGRSIYAASKTAVTQLTKVLAIEWAGRGVRVNAVSPTATHTPMNAALFADENWRRRMFQQIPAARFAEPRDVLGAVLFLASDLAAMVHGHNLLVDGGYTAW